jgi:hypothetical protein
MAETSRKKTSPGNSLQIKEELVRHGDLIGHPREMEIV